MALGHGCGTGYVAPVGLTEPRRSWRIRRIASMRAALVSPYSWTYPGGVTRHIEALAGELAAGGHEIRVFAPFDHDTRTTALRHRGARPQVRARARVAGAARRHDRLAVQRRRLQPRAHAVGRLHAAARAARLRARRRAPARAGGARDRLGRAHERRRAARRHLPLLLGVAPAALRRRAARRPPQAQPPPRAARGLRGRGLDRPALLRRPLPDRPQRRRCPPAACRRRAAAPPASRCGSSSSARPSSARACRCCCAPSRRCAARSPPS